MKNNKCHSIKMQRYLDNALDPEERDYFSEHVKTCPECKKQAQEQKHIDESLRINVENEIRQDAVQRGLADIEKRVLSEIRKKNAGERPFRSGWQRFARITAPAMAMAIMVIIVSYFYYDRHETVQAPSAIVNSISGSYASVMVMETPESHQTIIWYN